jgi:hypothetical protein
MYVCGDTETVRDRGNAPDVINVPVREQDSRGSQAVIANNLEYSIDGVLSWVDNQTWFAWAIGNDVTIRAECTGRESCDEHEASDGSHERSSKV